MQQEEEMRLFLEKVEQGIRKNYMDSEVNIVIENITEEELWIPMEDATKLRAKLYKPEGLTKLPLILQRTCYPQNEAIYKIHAIELAKRGYGFLYEYCRGTGGSEGSWEPNVNDRQDGVDTLTWLEQQDWVDCIGFWGDSYLAFTGWIMADVLTPKVKSLCLGNYGTDRYISAYEKSLFRHDVLTSWAMGNAGYSITADYLVSCRYRPHQQVDEALWGKKLEWYQQWITNTRKEDDYWQDGFWKQLKDIPNKVKVPVFISEGWFDHHLGSALSSWSSLSEEAKEHSRLDIGPLNHFGQNSITGYEPKHLYKGKGPTALEWFEQTLKQKRLPEKAVNLYVIGEDQWKEVPDWPSADGNKLTLYLNGEYTENNQRSEKDDARMLVYMEDNISGGLGSISDQPGRAGSFTYLYDPEDPVPSCGAESMLHTMNQIGSLLQPPSGYREDVITFQSEELLSDLQILGKTKVTLWVTTDAEDTAFTAKLMEVTPEGEAYNIRSSITTVAADVTDYQPGTRVEVHIDFWDIAWTVKKGYKLRLDISSSDFPQYAIHSNYPGGWASIDKTKTAKQRIYYGKDAPSAIEFDVIS